MDAFDDGFGGEGEVEVDPAAEFLAKEQEELGDIGEDLGLHSPGGQPLEGGEPIQAFKEEEAGMDIFGGGFQAEIPAAASGPNYDAFGSEDVQGMTSGMSGMTMREEPECIKKWKVEQEEMLKKKDADEELKKEELRVKAAEELADWYAQYEEQLAKTRKANKEQEAATAVPEVNGIVPGQEWERVSKHCDFSAKAPGHTKDVSRMRSILLQLKQSPPTTRE
jgi:hypothetical protein